MTTVAINPYTGLGVCELLGIAPADDVTAVRVHVEPRGSWLTVSRGNLQQTRKFAFDTVNDGGALCELLGLPATAVSAIDIEIAVGELPSVTVRMLSMASGTEAFSAALKLIAEGMA